MTLWGVTLITKKLNSGSFQFLDLFLWACTSVLALSVRPLWEPDEARYAEIAREMVSTGDWLVPHLNGVLYFEKPPLQYWLSAIPIEIFGPTDWAPRVPLVIAIGLCVWASRKITRLLNPSSLGWPTLALLTSLMGFTMSQILTLDALFTSFLMMALALFLESETSENIQPRLKIMGVWLFLGLAFLTKGPAALVLFMGMLVAYGLIYFGGLDSLRLVNKLIRWDGILLFIIVVFPWFWKINQLHPGHSYFFFIYENFIRYTTNEHARQGSDIWILDKSYFIFFLIAGLLPWTRFTLVGLWEMRSILLNREFKSHNDSNHIRRLLFIFSFWILAFFSLSGSKLAPYIYPVLLPLLILVTTHESSDSVPQKQTFIGSELIILGLLLLIYLCLKLSHVPSFYLVFTLLLTFVFVGSFLWIARRPSTNTLAVILLLPMMSLLFSLHLLSNYIAPQSVKQWVVSSPKETEWLSLGTYFQGITYYSQKPCRVIAGTGELRFGKNKLPTNKAALQFYEDLDQLQKALEDTQRSNPGVPIRMIAKAKIWRLVPQELRERWMIIDESRGINLLLAPLDSTNPALPR
ncbi:MAG: ArnT family glycosyltransferase [Holophagaceae bacterium]